MSVAKACKLLTDRKIKLPCSSSTSNLNGIISLFSVVYYKMLYTSFDKHVHSLFSRPVACYRSQHNPLYILILSFSRCERRRKNFRHRVI